MIIQRSWLKLYMMQAKPCPLAFVVETHQVLHRHLHVVENHKGSSSTTRVSGFYSLGLNTHVARYEKHADTLRAFASANCCDKVVCEHAICDPFLDAVHNVVLPIRAFSCSR